MKPVLRILVLGTVALMLSPSAHAAGQGDLRGACKQDVATFCQDVQKGGGRILSCLKDHGKDLSDGCRSALKTAAEERQSQGGGVGGGQGGGSRRGGGSSGAGGAASNSTSGGGSSAGSTPTNAPAPSNTGSSDTTDDGAGDQ